MRFLKRKNKASGEGRGTEKDVYGFPTKGKTHAQRKRERERKLKY